MKSLILTCLVAGMALQSMVAQQVLVKNSDMKILENISDNVLENGTFNFCNTVTGETIQEVTEKNYSSDIKIKADNNTWNYWNGVLNLSMLGMAEITGDEKYINYTLKHIKFAFDNIEVFKAKYTPDKNKWGYPFGQLIVMEEFDDCGAMGASVIEAYKLSPKKEYKDYIDKVGEFMLNFPKRLDDGTFVRDFPRNTTLWGDDLYMSISFLSRMGELTGDSRYFNEATKQVINFTKYLYDENTGVYYHCYYPNLTQQGVARWLRANGWIMMAQVELLSHLPEDYPQREKLVGILQKHILGVSRYQSAQGLWHQLIDKSDTYLESSGSSMFIYSIARAVQMGWVEDGFKRIAIKGWQGLQEKITADGQVKDICVGTGIRDYLGYYSNRMTLTNDIHGLGAIILAGTEIVKLKNNLE